jgi:methylated-DNA-protein-cysteine methyltransferase-like protein
MGRTGRTPPHPFADPWPDDHRPTAFQAAVVAAVDALEPGDLVTFGEVAEQIGRPGGGQAVANVLRAAPDLPWWRVLPSDGRVYRNLASVQIPLLRAEGHHVDDRRNVRAGPPRDEGTSTIG